MKDSIREWLEEEITPNPFSDAYHKQELEFYGLKLGDEPYKDNGLTVKILSGDFKGVLADYLNKRYRIGFAGGIPALFRDSHLWMSITPMEVQSHWVPIQMACGFVAVVGLGLGYAMLRIMEKEDVESVDVYEIDPRVVEFNKKMFHDRKGFEKVNFIVGDARELLKKKEYDFAYVDIYDTMCPDTVISDIRLFGSNNFIATYRFWAEEMVFADAIFAHELESLRIPYIDRKFLLLWMRNPLEENPKLKSSDLFQPRLDEDFINDVIEALEEHSFI